MTFNYLDGALLVVLAAGGIYGFIAGFWKQLFGIMAWTAAIASLIFLSDPVNDLIRNNMSAPEFLFPWVGLVLCFVVPLILVNLIGNRLSGGENPVLPDTGNRLLGSLFGILKGAFLSLILLWLLNLGGLPPKTDIDQSTWYKYFDQSCRSILSGSGLPIQFN